MNIREKFKKYELKKHDGVFGVEIETETSSHADYPKGFFSPAGSDKKGNDQYSVPITDFVAVSDGSLRNFGREFVTVRPLTLTELYYALVSFGEQTKDIPFIQNAPATSVHVHVNMCEETCLTLINFITTWVLLENIMIEYCGTSRRSNLFARPIRTSEGTIDYYLALIDRIKAGVSNAIYFNESEVKYAALNIAPLTKFGSVEVRCFRGTTNAVDIYEWVSLLDKIRLYAKSDGLTPSDIVKAASNDPEFLISIFGDHVNEIMTPSTADMLSRNLVYGLSIAQAADWSTFGTESIHVARGVSQGSLTGSIADVIIQDEYATVSVEYFSNLEDDDEDDDPYIPDPEPEED